MEITIGTSFMKQFGKAGLFRGVVVLKHKDAEIGFRVKYEDGDEEDLDEGEIQTMIAAPNKSSNTPAKKKNVPTATKSDKMEIQIGTSFMKKFGRHGMFRGVVVQKHEDAEMGGFRVKYEDGDEEDLDEGEIQTMIAASNKSASSTPPANKQNSPGGVNNNQGSEAVVVASSSEDDDGDEEQEEEDKDDEDDDIFDYAGEGSGSDSSDSESDADSVASGDIETSLVRRKRERRADKKKRAEALSSMKSRRTQRGKTDDDDDKDGGDDSGSGGEEESFDDDTSDDDDDGLDDSDDEPKEEGKKKKEKKTALKGGSPGKKRGLRAVLGDGALGETARKAMAEERARAAEVVAATNRRRLKKSGQTDSHAEKEKDKGGAMFPDGEEEGEEEDLMSDGGGEGSTLVGGKSVARCFVSEGVSMLPAMATLLKPHQRAAVRFIFANLVVSLATVKGGEEGSTSSSSDGKGVGGSGAATAEKEKAGAASSSSASSSASSPSRSVPGGGGGGVGGGAADGFGCALAHNMGLGKTLSAIASLHVLMTHPSLGGAHKSSGGGTVFRKALVVAPAVTLENWEREFKSWKKKLRGETATAAAVSAAVAAATSPSSSSPSSSSSSSSSSSVPWFSSVLRVASTDSLASRVATLRQWGRRGGVCVIGYEAYVNLVKPPASTLLLPGKGKGSLAKRNAAHAERVKQHALCVKLLQDPGPDVVVLDEGHRLKSLSSRLATAVHAIKTKRRVVLTGTPLQNNLDEYFAMLSWCRPGLLGTPREFRNRFANPVTAGLTADADPSSLRLGKQRMAVLHLKVQGFVHRRSAATLVRELPPKREVVLCVRLVPLQQKMYKAFLRHRLAANLEMSSKKENFAAALALEGLDLEGKRLHQEVVAVAGGGGGGTGQALALAAFQAQLGAQQLSQQQSLEQQHVERVAGHGVGGLLAMYQALQQVGNHPNAFFRNLERRQGDAEERERRENGGGKKKRKKRKGGSDEEGDGYESMGDFVVGSSEEEDEFTSSESEEESDEESDDGDKEDTEEEAEEVVEVADVSSVQVAAKRKRSKDAGENGDKLTKTAATSNGGRDSGVVVVDSDSGDGGGAEDDDDDDDGKKPKGVAEQEEEEGGGGGGGSGDWHDEFSLKGSMDEAELSGKAQVFLALLDASAARGEKVLAFSQSLAFLDVLEAILSERTAPPLRHTCEAKHTSKALTQKSRRWKKHRDWVRLDGSTNQKDRQRIVDAFNKSSTDPLYASTSGGSDLALMLMSTQMGVGVNLTAATRVVILDASWNPANDSQAVFRAWRYGQTKPVFVYRLLSAGTIEEKVYARQVTKAVATAGCVDDEALVRTFNHSDLHDMYTFNDKNDGDDDGDDDDYEPDKERKAKKAPALSAREATGEGEEEGGSKRAEDGDVNGGGGGEDGEDLSAAQPSMMQRLDSALPNDDHLLMTLLGRRDTSSSSSSSSSSLSTSSSLDGGDTTCLGKLVPRAFPHDDLLLAKESEDLTAEDRAEGLRNFDQEFVNPPAGRSDGVPLPGGGLGGSLGGSRTSSFLPPQQGVDIGNAATQYHVTFFGPSLGLKLLPGGRLPVVSVSAPLLLEDACHTPRANFPVGQRGPPVTVAAGDRLVAVNGTSVFAVQQQASAIAVQKALANTGLTETAAAAAAAAAAANISSVNVATALVQAAGRPLVVSFLPAARWQAFNGAGTSSPVPKQPT